MSNTLLKIPRPEILPYHGTAPLLLVGGRETGNLDPKIGGTSATRFHSSFVAPVLRPQGQPGPLALISTSMEVNVSTSSFVSQAGFDVSIRLS
jgi:hypothetical protein